MKTTKQTLLTIIICLAILAGVNLVYGAWSNPPYQGVCNDPPCPPGGNTPEPINVSGSSQYKSGALSIGGLLQVGALQLSTGAGVGKVLKSDDSGIATWGTDTDTDTDTKCNNPGNCSQVCIGSDCRSGWPSAEEGTEKSIYLCPEAVCNSESDSSCSGQLSFSSTCCCLPACDGSNKRTCSYVGKLYFK